MKKKSKYQKKIKELKQELLIAESNYYYNVGRDGRLREDINLCRKISRIKYEIKSLIAEEILLGDE